MFVFDITYPVLLIATFCVLQFNAIKESRTLYCSSSIVPMNVQHSTFTYTWCLSGHNMIGTFDSYIGREMLLRSLFPCERRLMTRPSREFVYVNGSIYLTNQDVYGDIETQADNGNGHKSTNYKKSDELWHLAVAIELYFRMIHSTAQHSTRKNAAQYLKCICIEYLHKI